MNVGTNCDLSQLQKHGQDRTEPLLVRKKKSPVDSVHVWVQWGQNRMGWIHEIWWQRQSSDVLPYLGAESAVMIRDIMEGNIHQTQT